MRLLFELVKEERVSRGCPLGHEKRKWLGVREALPGVRPCGAKCQVPLRTKMCVVSILL